MTHPLLKLDRGNRSHPTRCVTLYGALGCYTAGWQEAIEVGSKVKRWMVKDPAFNAALLRTFNKHRKGMPQFLGLNREHTTTFDGDETPDTLIISTECSKGAPSWEPRRTGSAGKNGCFLDTIIALASEI